MTSPISSPTRNTYDPLENSVVYESPELPKIIVPAKDASKPSKPKLSRTKGSNLAASIANRKFNNNADSSPSASRQTSPTRFEPGRTVSVSVKTKFKFKFAKNAQLERVKQTDKKSNNVDETKPVGQAEKTKARAKTFVANILGTIAK